MSTLRVSNQRAELQDTYNQSVDRSSRLRDLPPEHHDIATKIFKDLYVRHFGSEEGNYLTHSLMAESFGSIDYIANLFESYNPAAAFSEGAPSQRRGPHPKKLFYLEHEFFDLLDLAVKGESTIQKVLVERKVDLFTQYPMILQSEQDLERCLQALQTDRGHSEIFDQYGLNFLVDLSKYDSTKRIYANTLGNWAVQALQTSGGDQGQLMQSLSSTLQTKRIQLANEKEKLDSFWSFFLGGSKSKVRRLESEVKTLQGRLSFLQRGDEKHVIPLTPPQLSLHSRGTVVGQAVSRVDRLSNLSYNPRYSQAVAEALQEIVNQIAPEAKIYIRSPRDVDAFFKSSADALGITPQQKGEIAQALQTQIRIIEQVKGSVHFRVDYTKVQPDAVDSLHKTMTEAMDAALVHVLADTNYNRRDVLDNFYGSRGNHQVRDKMDIDRFFNTDLKDLGIDSMTRQNIRIQFINHPGIMEMVHTGVISLK